MFKSLMKKISFFIIHIVWHFNPALATSLYAKFLISNGAKVSEKVNYLSARIWFDGADYSKIHIGEGVTISSNVRVLTHDWSPYTAARGLGIELEKPIGVLGKVEFHDYCFIGSGVLILPNTTIGKGAIIGAGSVVKGNIEPFSIVAGNPARKIGTTKEFLNKNFPDLGIEK